MINNDASKKVMEMSEESTPVVTLSTGKQIHMDSDDFEEGLHSFENLTHIIVDEHFKDLIKSAMSEGNYDFAVENILRNEVLHVLNNEISDHKHFLEWVFMTFILNRFNSILEEMQNKAPNLFYLDTPGSSLK